MSMKENPSTSENIWIYLHDSARVLRERIKFYAYLRTFILHPLVNQARALMYFIPLVNKRGYYTLIIISGSLLVQSSALSIILILIIRSGIILV